MSSQKIKTYRCLRSQTETRPDRTFQTAYHPSQPTIINSVPETAVANMGKTAIRTITKVSFDKPAWEQPGLHVSLLPALVEGEHHRANLT